MSLAIRMPSAWSLNDTIGATGPKTSLRVRVEPCSTSRTTYGAMNAPVAGAADAAVMLSPSASASPSSSRILSRSLTETMAPRSWPGSTPGPIFRAAKAVSSLVLKSSTSDSCT